MPDPDHTEDAAVSLALLDRAEGLLSEGFESGVIVGRDWRGEIFVRSLAGDPVIALGLLDIAKDVLLGAAVEDVIEVETRAAMEEEEKEDWQK